MKIKRLGAEVANQIAAGEVIENPASVVKELMENALDAGASRIDIELDFGGLNRIKVSDNGCGIEEEDLPLAIEAHATSKLSSLNDLYYIQSMGFRGEALASMAAVSKLIILSKPETQKHAACLTSIGGKVEVCPGARAPGTTIELSDLFYNTPVRKKFLKSARREYLSVEAMVKRFALSCPNILLTLTHDGKKTLNLPAAVDENSMQHRIRLLLGKSFVEQSHYIEVKRLNLGLHGWLSGEEYQRSQNDKIWIYINHRMVKDKLILHALRQAYESILHPGRYPACVLYLTLPSNELDVNVHPTKHEVRFQQPRLVHDFVLTQLKSALDKNTQYFSEVKGTSQASTERTLEVNEECTIRTSSNLYSNAKPPTSPMWLVIDDEYIITYLHDLPYLIHLKLVKKMHLSNLLEETEYPWPSRPLLVPVRFQLEKSGADFQASLLSSLHQLGVEIDYIADNELIVRTIPKALPQLNIQRFLHQCQLDNPTSISRMSDCLIDCALEGTSMSLEEQEELLYFMEQQIACSQSDLKWYQRLDGDICARLLANSKT